MFRAVSLVLLNKLDLLPYLDVDLDLLHRNVSQVNPGATMVPVSARTGEGLDAWHDWLVTAAVGAGVSAADR
jgi:hydrogenase nickel incorporation protein HypB